MVKTELKLTVDYERAIKLISGIEKIARLYKAAEEMKDELDKENGVINYRIVEWKKEVYREYMVRDINSLIDKYVNDEEL